MTKNIRLAILLVTFLGWWVVTRNSKVALVTSNVLGIKAESPGCLSHFMMWQTNSSKDGLKADDHYRKKTSSVWVSYNHLKYMYFIILQISDVPSLTFRLWVILFRNHVPKWLSVSPTKNHRRLVGLHHTTIITITKACSPPSRGPDLVLLFILMQFVAIICPSYPIW